MLKVLLNTIALTLTPQSCHLISGFLLGNKIGQTWSKELENESMGAGGYFFLISEHIHLFYTSVISGRIFDSTDIVVLCNKITFYFSNEVFASADTAYVLAYSIIMLTTDLHSAQVKTFLISSSKFFAINVY